MRRTSTAALLFVVLVVLAGCSGFGGLIGQQNDNRSDDGRLGWENGYSYDEPIDVSMSNGLNESERQAVISRMMARIETIRTLEFTDDVSVAVISRATYRNRSGGERNTSTENHWNEQVWEALLLIGEGEQVESSFDSTLGQSVQGYYSPSNDSIVVVSDAANPTIDRMTLSHELVHALQDQHANLGATPPTQDQQLARRSVTEGEANYVQALYRLYCLRQWQCIERPVVESGSGGRATNGVFLVIFQPYATGPQFIDSVRESGGWEAVSDLYRNPPNSTEQVIHPALYPEEKPVNVTVADRSNAEWSRFDHDPVADTVGEASIYAMLFEHGVANVSRSDRFRYESVPSSGWGGDALVPYRNGSGGYGYVWEIRWDTTADAREFVTAYRSILAQRTSVRPAENIYILPNSDPYGDAFRVVRDGTLVRIVNAPTREALSAIHDPPP